MLVERERTGEADDEEHAECYAEGIEEGAP
jgi:hypothetical protein